MILIPCIVCLVFALLFFGYGLYITIRTHKINYEIDTQNRKWLEKNEKLKLENIRLGEEAAYRYEELAKISEQERLVLKRIEEQNEEVQKAFENYCNVLDSYYDLKELEHDQRISSLQGDYDRQVETLQREARAALEKYMDTLEIYYKRAEEGFDEAMQQITYQMAETQHELDKIRATYAATKEAQKREEEMIYQADFYSLHLTPLDQDTISLIEDLKPRLPEPRVLSMLIWQTYFQKQMNTLCSNVLGTDIVCGIYKITNKKSGLCYIGQAANVADRWKQHAKCGLGIDTPAQNKLYKAMLSDGLTNFTFELLEACPRAQLNEKEKYYIELYQSYDYGYNSNRGVN